MPYPLYTYVLNVYDILGLLWFYVITTIISHLVANLFYAYTEYMIFKYILKITFLSQAELIYLTHSHIYQPLRSGRI